MKKTRSFSGTNNARKGEARVKADINDALECGVAVDVANRLVLRGKVHSSNLPDAEDEIFVNRGHGKNYGPRQKKKNYTRTSIRENPLTEEDFYDELD